MRVLLLLVVGRLFSTACGKLLSIAGISALPGALWRGARGTLLSTAWACARVGERCHGLCGLVLRGHGG